MFVVPLLRLFSLAFTDSAGPFATFATLGESDVYRRKILVMSPDNIKDMLIINEGDAGKYMNDYAEKWNQLMLE